MSSSHAALIVDADPKGLEALVYGFQGADWRITACPTPDTASLLVKASGASIVVIASRSEHEKAHALIRQIRAKETFRTLPLLVLGPEELRKPLKDGGDVDLLPLPAFVRDVLTASQLLVEAGAAAARKPGEEPCLDMPIEAMTTRSLIRTLCGLARSGLLQLERKGRHGELLFHEGELTAAQVGQLQAMAAVQHVLIWDEGALKLRLRPVARRGQLHQTAQEFLDEFDRFQRDFAHAMKNIGPSATVYAKNEERLLHSANAVPAEVTPVVRLCDGQRTLSDIIDECPFRVLDTVRILGRLVDLAILVRRDPKPESGSKAARPPLEEFWETAQIVGTDPPRAIRPRTDDIGETPTPPPVLVTPPAAQTSTPAVAGQVNARSQGHTHKKTLEIVPPAALTPAVEPRPATQPTGETAPTRPAPQPAATYTPLAQLPVTGTLQGTGVSQAGTAHSPFSTVPKIAVPGTQASGTIEPRDRRTQSNLRAVPARTSVVLDIAQLETGKAPDPIAVQAPVVQAPIVQAPIVQAPIVQAPIIQAPVVPATIAPAPAGDEAAKITGEFQVAPSRRTVRQMPAQTSMSIQIDASLAPGPEMAAIPARTEETPKVTPNPMRLTGEMKIPTSAKSPQNQGKPERTSSSFQIDPALTADMPAATSAEGTLANGGQSDGSPAYNRKQSGSFSPIEKDFFEREADLYQVEGTESFADLDEKRAKAGSKSAPSKKAGRPNRK